LITHNPPLEFLAILASLSEVYHREVSNVESQVQWEALKDIPIPSLQRAAMALIKSSKYFPVPAAIREQVRVQAPLVDTIGPPPKEIKLLADVRSQRRAERADPAVGVAMALKAAWDEREKMQEAGVPAADLAKGLAAVLMDVMPPQRVWVYNCDECHDTGLLNGFKRLSSYPCDKCIIGRKFWPIARDIQSERERRGL